MKGTTYLAKATQGKGDGKKGAKGIAGKAGNGGTIDCYRCGERHFARDCPNEDLRGLCQIAGAGFRSVYDDG